MEELKWKDRSLERKERERRKMGGLRGIGKGKWKQKR
jgi:hypothetical protein